MSSTSRGAPTADDADEATHRDETRSLCGEPRQFLHTPREHTPLKHTPREHTPLEHTPREHTPREHTPREQTPLQHTPREHTPLEPPGPPDEPSRILAGRHIVHSSGRIRRARDWFELDDALGQHVTMRLVDDRVLVTEPEHPRLIARVLLARGTTRDLVSFGVADNHLHAVLTCSRAVAGVFARAVETSLRHLLALRVPFAPARFRPIVDQQHLGNATSYSVRQQERHGVRLDPLREGTSLPDVLGLRVLDPSLATRFAARLPRVERADLLALLGVHLVRGPVDLEPLADAAAAALALPDLHGQDPERMAAKRAAVHVGLAADLRPSQIAELLTSPARTVQRLAGDAPRTDLVRAVCLQLRLRTGVARR